MVTLWGLDFHLNRIRNSFQSLVDDHVDVPFETSTENALNDSRQLISSIVDHLLFSSECYVGATEANDIKTSIITIIWQWQASDGILVSGHLYSTNIFSDPKKYNPNPITASIAPYDSKLPSRFNHHPRAKLTSWCRLRRSIEKNFKTEGIGEVILTKKSSTSDNLELLEGLTSNLFIVYRDGSIRTPTSNVLGGYSQYIIINAAKELGFTIVDKPITLKDGLSNKWAEAFISSSIKLITPVEKILYKDSNIIFEWNEAPLFRLAWKCRRWKELYHVVIGKMMQTDT